MGAHSDWINTLQTDSEGREMYSGGKEGIVKVWKLKNKKLKCMAQLSSNCSSINSICSIDKQFGKMFAQGSSDKSIRMWKFKDLGPSEGENMESDESEDENLKTQMMDDDEVDREN